MGVCGELRVGVAVFLGGVAGLSVGHFCSRAKKCYVRGVKTGEQNKPENDSYLDRAAALLGEMVDDSDSSALRFGLTAIRAGNRLQSDLDARSTRPNGMSWAAFRVLFTIASLGKMAPKQLARLSSTSPATISSVLSTLERDGYITKTADVSDARSISVELTDVGRQRAVAIAVLVNERMQEWMDLYTPGEVAILVELIGRLIDRRPPA